MCSLPRMQVSAVLWPDLLYLRDRGRIVEGASADLVVLDDAPEPGDILIVVRWHMRDGKLSVIGRFG